MNTDRLAKLYDRLTPRERLPLILAASARGDETEKDRLARSAPQRRYQLPDYHGLGDGLIQVSLRHMVERLNLAAQFWGTSFLFKEDLGKNRLPGGLRLLAYAFTARVEGWERFCAGLKIDADALLVDLPGYDLAKLTIEAARVTAFTAEAAAAWLRRKGGPNAEGVTVELATAEAVAASYQDFVERCVAWWE
jgi:hypothetical protein